jgi:ATP-dependent Clp endopeptidase proteolytic subunit ClpP
MRWYEIKNKKDTSEIWLYDEIGMWGTGAKEFIVELNAIKSNKIDMHINSPGGDVFDGAAIYNAVRRHPATVTSFIDGIAASIASVIALSGEKVVMAENAIFMMHNPSGLTFGTAEDMRKTADILDKVRETMIGAYVAKSGKEDDEIKELLDGETWLNAEEAKEAGFADEVGDLIDLAACAKFIPVMSKMGFKNVPLVLNQNKGVPSPKDLETALRDAGCTRSRAKQILAKGLGKEDERDVQTVPQVPPCDAETARSKDRVNDLLIRAEMAAPSN